MINTDKPDQIDPLEILREEARAAALCHGVDRCDELAENLVLRYSHRLGGAHIYLPKTSGADRKKIHLEIERKFNGVNIRELASEYNLSTRHLRRIISGK